MKGRLSKLKDSIIIIIGIGILRLLIYGQFSDKQDLAMNATLQTDLEYLKVSLRNYQFERNTLPEPRGNTQVFTKAGKYIHSQQDSNAYGISGFVQDSLLPLNGISLHDPRNNHFYAYAKSKNNKAFEVGGIWKEGSKYKTYSLSQGIENGSKGLIKEYAGPHFVDEDTQTYLPYPHQDDFIAKVEEFSGEVKIDGYEYFAHQLKDFALKKGSKLEVGTGSKVVIYYGNGGMSTIGSATTKTKITFQDVSYDIFGAPSIQLYLESGNIWSRISHSSVDTPFVIFTPHTVSKVMGTEFGMSIDENQNTNLTVKSGKVIVERVLKNPNNKNIFSQISMGMKSSVLESNSTEENALEVENFLPFENIIKSIQNTSVVENQDGDAPIGFWTLADGTLKAGTIEGN